MAGPIGTLPWYYENGLVSDGDPAVAFGPQPGANGGFSWANGSRLYYANLTANLSAVRSEAGFKGFEAIAVSRTDNVALAATGGAAGKAAWKAPVVISKQSSTTFSDKEQIWADNAASSAFFGTVYVCWAAFRGQELSPNAAPAPLQVGVSHDGGDTWTVQQIGAAANNRNRNPMDGCTIRTDSSGNAYLYGIGRQGADAFEIQAAAGRRTGDPARHHRSEHRQTIDRWARGRAKRSRSRAERRYRQRSADRHGRDEPHRDELRQRRDRQASRLLRRVD